MIRKRYYLVFLISSLFYFKSSIQSRVSPLTFEIIFSTPSIHVISEKQRVMQLYEELSDGVENGSLYEVILLSKERFLSEYIEYVEMKGDTLRLYFDKKWKLVIKGTFEDNCKVRVEQESWFVEMFRK